MTKRKKRPSTSTREKRQKSKGNPNIRKLKQHSHSIFFGVIVAVLLLLCLLVIVLLTRDSEGEPVTEPNETAVALEEAEESEDAEEEPEEETPYFPVEHQPEEVTASEIPWYLTLINENQPLEEDFRPELAQVTYGHFVDTRIVEAASQLLASAQNAGIILEIAASFRDYDTQRNLFDYHMAQRIAEGYGLFDSFQLTRQGVAIPGASEHQAGLAIDLVPLNNMIPSEELSDTPEIQWLVENAWRYGFIMRYPYGTTHITGVIYEPWHWRYVGVEAAEEIMRLGITLEEYLEKHFGLVLLPRN